MAENKVLRRASGQVVELILNRPDKLNAIDLDLLEGIESICRDVVAAEDVRVVIVRGAGRMFCAGADLEEVDRHLQREGGFAAFLERWHQVFGLVEALPVPTVAAIQGHAFAGGFELMQVCDFVVLSDEALVGDQHARFGLFPGGGSTQRLIRQVGLRRAKWMLVSGEPVSAQEALDAGLVNSVVPPHKLEEEVGRYVDILLARSPSATMQIKRALAAGSQMPAPAALDFERAVAVEHMASTDVAVGIQAFRERAEPVFQPRRAGLR